VFTLSLNPARKPIPFATARLVKFFVADRTIGSANAELDNFED
jgi:hypothetical protein